MKVRKVIGGIIVIVSVICLGYFYNDPNLTWITIDVNDHIQGDAHLIYSKNKGDSLLVDVGYFNEGKKVMESLRENSIREIEYLLITHYHVDHYGGLFDLDMTKLKIKNVIVNPPNKEQCNREPWGCKFEDLQRISSFFKQHNISVIQAVRGNTYSLGDKAKFKIVMAHDGIREPIGTSDMNDMSIVVRVEEGENSFLLTGDLHEKTGRYLHEKNLVQEVDIIKYPHHGAHSNIPLDFYRKLQAKEVIFTNPMTLWCDPRTLVGRNTAREVFSPATIYTTAMHGDITVRFYKYFYLIEREENKIPPCNAVDKNMAS